MRVLLISVSVAAVVFIGACATLPGIGAGALLHSARNRSRLATPAACRDETFAGAGVMLRGWRCTTTAARRGTIVWLHGVADNHGSAAGLVDRFVPRGFDLVAYDSRAHGDSDGDVCTYGFYEKDDLARVIDTLEPGPVVLIGDSLGGAVARRDSAGLSTSGAARAFRHRRGEPCTRGGSHPRPGAADSWRRGRGHPAGSLAADLRGADGAEAADPRARRHAQFVASARRVAGDRSVDRGCRAYTSTSDSIRSSGMISPVFFAPALIALYSSVARRTRLAS